MVPVIGLEIHARIKSTTKLWCRCLNEPVPEFPNKNVCPICMGFPGMLPMPNQTALELALRASIALGCEINTTSFFDRKNYVYPDLPLGYQISQYATPIGEHGELPITQGDKTKMIHIERLHIENDAGKLSHYAHGSFVDYNRSGAPLMEIVSGPDISSVEEASLYAKEVQNTLRSIEASDCDMEKGQMRFDANISIHEPGTPFGTKVEIKNLNSFKSLEKAINYEIARQTKILADGGTIVQETRGWGDGKEKTISQRSKEEAADYRYFPEPDIPPIVFTEEHVRSIRDTLPELPYTKKTRYQTDLELDEDTARILAEDTGLSTFFEAVLQTIPNPKLAASWITSVLLGLLNEAKMDIGQSPISPEKLGYIITLVTEEKISHLSGKETLLESFHTAKDPKDIIDEHGYWQVSDTNELSRIITDTIAAFPTQHAEYKSGKEALFGFFVGQVMKASKGAANPKIVGDILKNML